MRGSLDADTYLRGWLVLTQVPKGKSVRFQAHSMDFLDLAASMGPKFLLESAMRNYSGLVKGETILVAFGGDKCVPAVLPLARWLTASVPGVRGADTLALPRPLLQQALPRHC